MSDINPDVDSILEDVADNPAQEQFLRDILDWEADNLNKARRKGKLNKIDESVEKYLEDK